MDFRRDTRDTFKLTGCTSDSDCPSTHPTCDSDHICNARPGKVLLKSITFVTDSCTGCTTEGVETTLVGEKISGFPDGITCDTQKLDHEGTIDFANGASTTFDGKMNGAQNDQEEDMMGACFEVIKDPTILIIFFLNIFLLVPIEQPTAWRLCEVGWRWRLGSKICLCGLEG